MTYYELTSIYGHDTFLLDVNNVGAAMKVRVLVPYAHTPSFIPYVHTYRAIWSQRFTEREWMVSQFFLTKFFFIQNRQFISVFTFNLYWQNSVL